LAEAASIGVAEIREIEMHIRQAIIRGVAPATLASTLLVLASALAGSWQPAEAAPIKLTCTQKQEACGSRCLKTYGDKKGPNGADQAILCMQRTCDKQKANCDKAEGNKSGGQAGVQDTGGTGKPPKAGSSTSPGGGVATDPKSPPKGTGPRAPLSGGVFNQPSTTGSGGSQPILKSGGSKR
jgi:hypothetical protein